MPKSNSHFGSRAPTFTCATCDRRTRNTGQDSDSLCADCYEIAGIDNTINDCGFKPGMPEFDEYLAELTRRLAHIEKLGGDVVKVKACNGFCFPVVETESK